MQLIPITIIFIIAYIYSAILNKKTTYTIPLTFLTLIITTIIFGYLNILKYVDIFLIVASLIALFYIYHKKLYKNKMFFNYQTLMFLIFCIFITILNYKFTIFEWDAFSHWATAAKYMIQNNVFFNQSSYPPGITSLQYVYTKLAFSSFNESYLVNALLMFTMSLFMPLFDLIKNNHKFIPNFLGLILFMIMPLTFFTNLYGSVYVDCILGLELAFILFNYYSNKNKNFKTILIILGLFTIVNTKEIGLVLACSFILCLIIDKILKKEITIKKILLFMFVIAVSYLSWNIYLKFNPAEAVIGTTDKISLISELLTKEKITYMVEIANNFLNYISNQNIQMNILNVSFINFIVISIFILLLFKKNNSIKDIIIIAICYLGFLAFSYMCFFSEEEALILASLDRYIYTLYIAIIFLIMAIIMSKTNVNISVILLGYIILFGNFTAIEYNLLFKPYSSIKNKEYRLEYDQAKTIKETAKKGSKIYFLDTNNTPYAYYLARYENIDMLFANPIYSKDINEEIINKFDYLYVYSYNEELKEKFDELKEFTLYKIEKNKFKEVSNEK